MFILRPFQQEQKVKVDETVSEDESNEMDLSM